MCACVGGGGVGAERSMWKRVLTGDAIRTHLQQQNLGTYIPMSKKQDPAIQSSECKNYVNK